jgi:hypothetical protein
MKKLFAVLLLLGCSLQAFADFSWVEGTDVRYVGGTAAGVAADTMGKLDITSPTELVFTASGARISIPYAGITNFRYQEEVAHHYGVIGATLIGLLKARRQQHFLHIAYRDSNGNMQTAVFEVSKDSQAALRTTIQARLSDDARRAS